MRHPRLLLASLWLSLPLLPTHVAAAQLPEDHRALRRTVSYAEMEAFLAGV